MSLFEPDLDLVSLALFESPDLDLLLQAEFDLVSLLDFELEDQVLVPVVAGTLKLEKYDKTIKFVPISIFI